jgi:DNA-directed RNA polymerase specialized sigma24 family protein
MDVEDLEQEFMLAVLERVQAYDSKRAKFSTFIDRVLDHTIKDYCAKLLTHKRRHWSCAYTFIKDGDAVYDPTSNVQLAIDLNRVEDLLPEPLASLFSQLKVHSANEIAHLTKTPKSTLYEAVEKLRAYLRKYKLHHYG